MGRPLELRGPGRVLLPPAAGTSRYWSTRSPRSRCWRSAREPSPTPHTASDRGRRRRPRPGLLARQFLLQPGHAPGPGGEPDRAEHGGQPGRGHLGRRHRVGTHVLQEAADNLAIRGPGPSRRRSGRPTTGSARRSRSGRTAAAHARPDTSPGAASPSGWSPGRAAAPPRAPAPVPGPGHRAARCRARRPGRPRPAPAWSVPAGSASWSSPSTTADRSAVAGP